LIIFISGDNGASAEGTRLGTPNEIAMFNGVDVPVADQLKNFHDIWGSAQTFPHVAPRPNVTAGRTEFNYTVPVIGIPLGDSPGLLNTSYTITADIEVPAGGAEGMLMTEGGRFGGWGLYLVKGKPVFTWNFFDLKRVRWEGPEQLAPASTPWCLTSNTTASVLARSPSTM